MTLHRVIALCVAALVVPLLYPLLTGQVFVVDDLGVFHLPLRHAYREALLAGDSVLWTPGLLSGFPAYAEGQVGMAHPLHLLLYRVLPLGVAVNLEILASYVALLAGVRLLLARYGLSAEAAWFGALLATFSGFMLLHLMHVNAIAVVAHGPWLLLASHILLTSSRAGARRVAVASMAALLASQLLLGYPQYVWFMALAVGYQAVCVVWAGASPRGLWWLGVAAGCGALMGGVQLLPTLDLLRDSVRSGTSLAFRLSGSLQPAHLSFLWGPNTARLSNLHELSVYDGAFAVVGLAWLAARWRQLKHRGLVVALLVFASAAVVLALGPSGGVYPWLARLPVLGGFRTPARHTVLLHLALAGLAAVAFDDLVAVSRAPRQWLERRLVWLVAPAAASVATMLVGALMASRLSHDPASKWMSLIAHDSLRANLLHAWPWTCLMLGVTGLVVLAARGQRWALPALVMAVALDQGLWGYTYIYGLSGEGVTTVARLREQSRVPPEVETGEALFDPRKAGNLALLRGLRQSAGYVGLAPARVLDPADPATQRVGGVTWRVDGETWVPVTGAMPRARLVTEARQSARVRADIQTLDVAQVALVDSDVGMLDGPSGQARLISDRPGHLVVETEAAGRQLLVVTERVGRGWVATEDGAPRSVVRVYGDYLGCVVSPGRHRVELRYRPDSVRAGLMVSGAGIVATLIAVWLVGRRREAMPTP